MLAPVSFFTWVFTDDHVVHKMTKTIKIFRERGGILNVDYNIKKRDYKKIQIDYITKTENLYEIRVRLDDAWNAYSTNAIIDFIITERA